MKNRKRQRENRRKHNNYGRLAKPWQNAEGYTDLTAYYAIRNADRKAKGEPKSLEH